MAGPVLLLSNSRVYGRGFLEHALDMVESVLAGRRQLLFLPFANSDMDRYTRTMQDALEPLGVRVQGAHALEDFAEGLSRAEAVFVGGGNSFRLLRALQRRGALAPLRARVLGGMPYLGASAGANVACPTIRTTNDMPIVEVDSLAAIGLVPFQLTPHYVDAAPDSTHMGETRAQRLEQFLEENDVPVLGLREGAWLHVAGERAELGGMAGARLFERGCAPVEYLPGADLSRLLRVEGRFDV